MPLSNYSLRQNVLYSCRKIEGKRVVHCSLLRSHCFIFKGFVRGDKEETAIVTLSGGAYSVHARRSRARARRMSCFIPMAVPSFLSGGRGVALSVLLYTWRRRFWHASQRVGRTSARNFIFFALAHYWLKGVGGERVKGCWRLSTFRGGAFGMHATRSEGQVRMTFCITPSVVPFFWCEGRD